MSTLTPDRLNDPEVVRTEPALTPVSWRNAILYGVIALVALFGFALSTAAADVSRLIVSTSNDAVQIAPLLLPSRTTALALAVIAVVLAALAFYATMNRKRFGPMLPVAFGVVVLLAFLVWVVAGNESGLPLPHLLSTALTAALPLVFGGIAGLLCERSGIINIAIEGQLLAGAFLAVVVGTATGSPYLGLIAAPIAGALVGLLLALFSIKYRVDQIIVGVVLNVLVIGLTNYLFSTVLTQNPGGLNSPPRVPVIAIPVLSQIPVLGPVLFRQTIIVYLMFALVAFLQVMVFRSRWGLRMRSVGEHPEAADTVGINVNRTRYRNTVLGSAIAGFGGAALVSVGLAFTKELTAGRGYIALAAMILGRWNPTGALAAALLFGFADSLNRVLGNIGSPVPSQLLAMLPYLATIFAVAGLVGRVRPPAAEGTPYPK